MPSACPPSSAATSARPTQPLSSASSSTPTVPPSLPSPPSAAAPTLTSQPLSAALISSSPASPGWGVSDCRGGYVLLCNGRTGQFAAYNPLTGALDLIPQTPDEFFDDGHGHTSYLDCFILASEEGDGPFRLVSICHDESRARAAVFSSDSREWRIFPWSEAVTPLPEDEHWLKVGTMVNGFIYWIHADEAYLLVLNTATLQFSQMDVPPFLEGQIHLVWVGEAKDGKLCIVCPVDFDIHVWFWRADEDGFERWMLDKKFQLELKSIVEATGGSLEDVELHIVDAIDGFVYFSTGETFHNVHSPSWFLSLCMETAKLDKLFQKRCDSHVRPYIMAWPPSLVNNKLYPLLEGEGA